MAKRLVTLYVKACLRLTNAEMDSFLQFFTARGVNAQVKICDNGLQEIVLEDTPGIDIVLSFKRRTDKYECDDSCKFLNLRTSNVFQQAVLKYKGDAIVYRIYSNYRIVYEYRRGTIISIKEVSHDDEINEKVIYEYKNMACELEQLFEKQHVEDQIAALKLKINALLDQRNQVKNSSTVANIDKVLMKCADQLFSLEA